MWEYGFLLARNLPYNDRIYNSVLIWENTGQEKPIFSHILSSVWQGVSNEISFQQFGFFIANGQLRYFNTTGNSGFKRD